MPTEEEMQAELERLRAENEKLKRPRGQMSMKVSEKGALSVYGLGRFPVTLYREQWEKLLGMSDEIRQFIQDNDANLKRRNSVARRRRRKLMEEPFAASGVRGFLHSPEAGNGHALLLTHGAGSNCQAPLLVRLSRAFESAGYLVLRYDLPFRQQRPKGPPFPAGAARDREGIAHAVELVRPMVNGRIFVGGHSYGGRQSAMLAA